MKAKWTAFTSYCSLNFTTTQIINSPFLLLDNGSFFRDVNQFVLKTGIQSQGQRLNLHNSLSRLQPTAYLLLPQRLFRGQFFAYDLFWYLSHCLYAFRSSLCPFPNDMIISPQTEHSSGGKQMEHLHTALYHSPTLELAKDSCSSDVCQHKDHSLQPLSYINIVKVLSCLED